MLECDRDFWRDAKQYWRKAEESSHEVIGAFRGEQICVLVRQTICLLRRLVFQIVRGNHTPQPLFHVARLQVALLDHILQRHPILACHALEEPGLDTDEPEASGHRARHIREDFFGECLYTFFVHADYPRAVALRAKGQDHPQRMFLGCVGRKTIPRSGHRIGLRQL